MNEAALCYRYRCSTYDQIVYRERPLATRELVSVCPPVVVLAVWVELVLGRRNANVRSSRRRR